MLLPFKEHQKIGYAQKRDTQTITHVLIIGQSMLCRSFERCSDSWENIVAKGRCGGIHASGKLEEGNQGAWKAGARLEHQWPCGRYTFRSKAGGQKSQGACAKGAASKEICCGQAEGGQHLRHSSWQLRTSSPAGRTRSLRLSR